MFDFLQSISVKSVLNSLSAHIAVLDKQGEIKYVNQAWNDFAINNSSTLDKCGVGVNYFEVMKQVKGTKEEREKIRATIAEIKSVIEGEKEIFTLEYTCHSPEEKRWFEMRVTPFSGNCECRVVVAHENITQRKLQEEELKTMKNFHLNISNNLEEVIMYLDTDLNLKWANNTAKNYFSLSLAQLQQQPCYSKFGLEKPCSNCPVAKVQESGQREQAIVEKPDGSIWQMKAIPDFSPAGDLKGIIEVSLDISKRKKVERKMKQIVNKLEEQVEKAGQLHDQFLPSKMPQISGLTLGTYYAPADRLGGDFYNFIKLDKKLMFYISDVSGHDLSGSMLNIFLKETINSYLIANNQTQNVVSPADILKFITNHFREEEFPADYFICLILGVLDIDTKQISFANAGIQFSPILIASGGQVSTFDCGGLPISSASAELEFEYQECHFELKEQDMFFLYTDGLIEQTNGQERYGTESLHQVLINSQTAQATAVIEDINDDFNQFRGDVAMQDDVTQMLIHHHTSDLCL